MKTWIEKEVLSHLKDNMKTSMGQQALKHLWPKNDAEHVLIWFVCASQVIELETMMKYLKQV